MMRLSNLLAGAAAAFLLASSAAAAEADKPKPAKEKKICRTETMSGRITPERICRTRAQWEARNARPRKAPGSGGTAGRSD